MGRSMGINDNSSFNPLEWAQIALNASSFDVARSQIEKQLSSALDINTLMITGGNPLPAEFHAGATVPFPAPQYISGVTVSREWMDFLYQYQRSSPDPLVQKFDYRGGPLFIWEGCDLIAQMNETEQVYAKNYFKYGLNLGAMCANFDIKAGVMDALLVESRGSAKEFKQFSRQFSEKLHLAYVWFCEASRVRELKSNNIHRVLSPRQRECLQWVADGYNTSEISEKLKLSEATINEHINESKKRLGVANRAQACARATMLKQITL